MFADTDKGAAASAMCFTIIESAKMNGLDVYGYLVFLLTEFPKLGDSPSEEDLQKLLPWASLPEYYYIK